MSLILSMMFLACAAVLSFHIVQLYKDKQVKGVSLIPTYVFIATNIFEVVYFYRLGDIMPTIGSAMMLVSNIIWLSMALYYKHTAVIDSFLDDVVEDLRNFRLT